MSAQLGDATATEEGAGGKGDTRRGAARRNVELPICHEKGSEMFSNKESRGTRASFERAERKDNRFFTARMISV